MSAFTFGSPRLVPCRDCSRPVSRRAAACPGCGGEVRRSLGTVVRGTLKFLVTAWLLVIIAVAFGMAWGR